MAVIDRVARTYVRWMPGSAGKRALVDRLAVPEPARTTDAPVVRTIHGARLRADQRTIMPRCIAWFGVWEPLLSRWIEERLRPGEVFVDVGANIGYFSLLAARRVGAAGRVVAIEPAAPTFAKLTANLGLNPGTPVRPVRAAVAADRGTIAFYRAERNDAESSTLPGHGREPAGEVDAFPLAALVSADEVPRTRIIKIDIEGGESDALRGLLPDVDRFPENMELAIEVHPGGAPGHEAAPIAEMLAPHGFAPAWLPVDFGAPAHLDRRPPADPTPGLPPPGRLVHLILSRNATSLATPG